MTVTALTVLEAQEATEQGLHRGVVGKIVQSRIGTWLQKTSD